MGSRLCDKTLCLANDLELRMRWLLGLLALLGVAILAGLYINLFARSSSETSPLPAADSSESSDQPKAQIAITQEPPNTI